MTGQARGIAFEFEGQCGFISALRVEDEGRTIDLLHRARWRGTSEAMPEGAAAHMARLAGDFFCAPFGAAAFAYDQPLHGWTANANWVPIENETAWAGAKSFTYKLERPVLGASVTKELTVRDGHPFLYQRHVFDGGSGGLPVANHAMVSLPNGGILSWSPKRWFETLGEPLESDPARGRSLLMSPARETDPRRFPTAAGGFADLSRYPLGAAYEDFVAAVEAPGQSLGWTAVVRPAEGDVFLSLRNASRLPLTMMWHSNGGRDYAPWNGRHIGVLGVEEGIGFAVLGVTSKEAEENGKAPDFPTALELDPDGSCDVRHVIGCLNWPTGERVAEVRCDGGTLVVRGEGDARRAISFDKGFLDIA